MPMKINDKLAKVPDEPTPFEIIDSITKPVF